MESLLVTLVPGGEGHIRIVYSSTMEIMIEAMDRIEKALAML
jgi:aspartate/methionine/tyrosine aminotransferase